MTIDLEVRAAASYQPTPQILTNMYFEGHVERIQMDVCKLDKMKVILGIPWLATHNPEIDWEKGEVKIMRCLPW